MCLLWCAFITHEMIHASCKAPPLQAQVVAEYRKACTQWKPFAQSLYIDLSSNPDEMPSPIHLGYRIGRNLLVKLLAQLQAAGVNHVALNLKYGKRSASDVLDELGQYVIPHFPSIEWIIVEFDVLFYKGFLSYSSILIPRGKSLDVM